MAEDVHRPVEVDEGVQGIPRGVLRQVLRPDARSQGRIRQEVRLQPQQALGQGRLGLAEALVRVRGGRIDHGAGGKHEGHGLEGVVGVLGHATAHAAGIVRQDAAHGAGVDGGGIGSHLRLEELEGVVHVGADDAGLHLHLGAALQHLDAAPVAGHFHQDAIRDSLTGQAGARGAEGHGDFLLMAQAEEPPDVLHACRKSHRLGDEPVEAGVRGEGDQVHRPIEDAVRSQDGREGIPQRGGSGRGHEKHPLPARGVKRSRRRWGCRRDPCRTSVIRLGYLAGAGAGTVPGAAGTTGAGATVTTAGAGAGGAGIHLAGRTFA